jgi:perosamine synthetase
MCALSMVPPDVDRVIPVMRPLLGAAEAAAASETVLSGWVGQGPRVAQFEEAFRHRVGAAHAVAVSSCTTALQLSLVVAEVGPGDDVIVPSLSFIAAANAVRYVGANPVFADVELPTQNISVDTIKAVLTPATKAVIAVDQGGIPVDIDAVRDLCDPLGIIVVQYAADAIGSTWRGLPVGARAELAVFSFHPRQVITTGEGGMLVTARPEWAFRARRLREHGMTVSAAEQHLSRVPVFEQYLETGFDFRMTDIQAAVGLVQLGRLDEIVARRRLLARRYHRLLAEIPELDGAVVAADPPDATTNFQSFWVLLPPDRGVSRKDVLASLAGHGVSARRGFMASHLEPAFAGHPHGDLALTERLTRDSLILPLYHDLTEDEQDRVVDVLAAALRAGSLSA